MTASEARDIFAALDSGKVIQSRSDDCPWRDFLPQDVFTIASKMCHGYELRVKPEPREFWINEYTNIECAMGRYAIHKSKEQADAGCGSDRRNCNLVHVREVIE